MDTQEKLDKEITRIIELARLAPSVHNIQPWKVSIKNDSIVIDVDNEHKLSDSDPTGRETIISLGIFAEAVGIIADQFGLKTSVLNFEKQQVSIQFVVTTNSKKGNEDIEALKTRTTDRSVYEHIDISSTAKREITSTAIKFKARVWVLTGYDAIEEIASLTSKGVGLALSNPGFRQELSQYLVVPWSSKDRGISTSSLYIPRVLAIFEPLFMRLGIGLKSEVDLEQKRWRSASGIVLITTQGDMPDYWFEAGRAYLRAALKIEQLGLSQATSAATVEASNYHEDIEKLLGTSERLQCVIRIGKGVKNRNHSPRVPAEKLITLS